MKKYFWIYSIILTLFTSCKKEFVEPEKPDHYSNGILLLNEGLFQQNNTSLSFYSFESKETHSDIFLKENGRKLGDTANDMVLFSINDKQYIAIVVDVSSQIEIIDAGTLKSVKQIPFFEGSIPKNPRKIVIQNYHAYVSCFDGTLVKINLLNFEVEKTIQIGSNPEGLVYVNDKLFVVNSGGLNYPQYDTTVSVIDLNTFEEIQKINTRINGSKILYDNQSHLYLISRGNYGSISPALLKIDIQSQEVVNTFDIPIFDMVFYQNTIYWYNQNEKGIFKFNPQTGVFDNSVFINCNDIQTFYGFHIHPITGHFFIKDAKAYVNTSKIHCYDKNGTFQYSFQGGLNTNHLIFK